MKKQNITNRASLSSITSPCMAISSSHVNLLSPAIPFLCEFQGHNILLVPNTPGTTPYSFKV